MDQWKKQLRFDPIVKQVKSGVLALTLRPPIISGAQVMVGVSGHVT